MMFKFQNLLMDGRNNKKRDLKKPPAEPLPKTNRSVPRGLLFRELGFNQKQNSVSKELQQAAEDNLVHKTHEEFVSISKHIS